MTNFVIDTVRELFKSAPKAPLRSKDPTTEVPLPTSGGRRSEPNLNPDIYSTQIYTQIGRYQTVPKQFLFQMIPVIRSLAMYNPDVSQALWNIVSLGNTGHKIMFDKTVDEALVVKMRHHIANRRKEWMAGQAGKNGMVNKMFYQLLIGGALSNEWIPNTELDGVEKVVLINPEDIEFVLGSNGTSYKPYQRLRTVNPDSKSREGLIALNTNTYKYFALNGDTEIPYGIPPYMPIVPDIVTQKKMKDNINFIVDQLGLIGFLAALVGKPPMMGGEQVKDYTIRMEELLDTAKTRLQGGLKDGIVAGFIGETEFSYNSIAREYDKAIALFKNNESQIASGMKQDPVLWGRDYNTSETQITVVFMKMLSELRNMQDIIKENLQFGYTLELKLAGFIFDYLTVQFHPSTLGDDLKLQQAQEIKIRNVERKTLLGIITQDQAADELGYESPAFPDPLVDWETLAGGKSQAELAIAKQKSEAGKNVSDKKVRKKNKPVPKD